jgi:hypothetical protein
MDGNCFYSCIGDEIGLSHGEVRKSALATLRNTISQPHGWTKFLEGGEREVQYFLRQHQQEGKWAENVLIKAVADAFWIDVVIWTEDGKTEVKSEKDGEKQKLEVGYIKGVHYFKLQPRVRGVHVERMEKERMETEINAEGESGRNVEAEVHQQIQQSKVSSVFNLGVEGLTSEMGNFWIWG